MTHDTHSGGLHSSTHSLKNYLVGFVLAVVLTAIPFGLVLAGALSHGVTFLVIAACALAQVIVHLRFFLGLRFGETPRENLLTMAFTAVLIVIMVGGSLWIMFDLGLRHDM